MDSSAETYYTKNVSFPVNLPIVITLDQIKSDNINRRMTMTDDFI